MAHNVKHSSALIHSVLDHIGSRCNSARIEIYDGKQPVDGDAPVNGKLLGAPQFASPAFHKAQGLAILAFPIKDDANGDASGTPGFFRVVAGDGSTVFDGTVGGIGDGCDMEFDTTEFQKSGRIRIETFTYRLRK